MWKVIKVTVAVTVRTESGYVNTLAIGEAVNDAVRVKHAEDGLTSPDDDAITTAVEVYVTE